MALKKRNLLQNCSYKHKSLFPDAKYLLFIFEEVLSKVGLQAVVLRHLPFTVTLTGDSTCNPRQMIEGKKPTNQHNCPQGDRMQKSHYIFFGFHLSLKSVKLAAK